MTHRTLDRSAELAVLLDKEVGESRGLTKEGFLFCKNVPLARAGWMIYGPGEVPISVGHDNLVRVHRSIEDLSAADVLASFEGKPVVNDHPPLGAFVDPKTWRQLAVGTTMNVRRGEGENADCIVADLLITDEKAIADVMAGKREVSAGYEADYEEVSPGEGRQDNIMGNHVALVMRGRCGPRCAIGDHATVKEPEMAKQRVRVDDHRRPRVSVVAAGVRKAFRDAEAQALEAMGLDSGDPDNDPLEPDGDEGGATHIHIHTGASGGDAPAADALPGADDAPAGGGDLETRVAALETGISQILEHLKGTGGGGGGGAPAAKTGDDVDGLPADDKTPPPDEDDPTKASRTGDSAALATSYQALIADAEVLVPGFRVPTFDSAATRAATIDRMCAVRRKALDACAGSSSGQALLANVSGSPSLDLDKMDCAAVATLFTAAAGAQRMVNMTRATTDANRVPEAKKPAKASGPQTISDLNKYYAEYYAGRTH